MEIRRRALALSVIVSLLEPPALAAVGLAGSPVLAAAVPRVVVVVGPSHEMTDRYLAWGESIAERAEAHGADVRRVFHPHATWSSVVAQSSGATVLVYIGHGNGFPSPYTSSLMPDRQDGMGLDPADGAADSDVRYYGEQYIRASIRLRSNAIVILNHLCYASGNSEPGQPDPTLGVAEQRVDNFASGFLSVGAAAVFALGHHDGGRVVDGLFGPPMTLDELFMATDGAGTSDVRRASVRTPGATMHLDPEGPAEYFRAVTGALDTLTTSVVDPSLVALPPAGGTPSTPVGAVPSVAIAGTPPASFSPNGDGVADTLTVGYSMSAAGSVDVAVNRVGGEPVRTISVPAPDAKGSVTWDGTANQGGIVADGDYTVMLVPRSPDGAAGTPVTVPVRVLAVLGHLTASPPIFEPRLSDTQAPSVGLGFTLDQPATVTWTIVNASGATVRTLASSEPRAAGTYAATWDGTGSATGGSPALLPDGSYQQVVTVTTGAGSSTLGTRFTMAPMRILLSASTRHAGQPLTVSMTFVEPLRGAPRVAVTQPGVAKYQVTPTRTAEGEYRVTFRLRPSAATGTLVIAVSGVGVGGASLSAKAKLPVR